VDTQSDDRRNYRVDFTKIRNALGFVPQWSVERGIRQVVTALRSGRVTDYQDPKYSNFKFFATEGWRHIRPVNGWANELIGESSSGREILIQAHAEIGGQPEVCPAKA
jgi:hypothetical protein